MQTLIYTRDDKEYERLRDALTEISGQAEVRRDPLDGHGHYSEGYDLIIVALDGARGMNEVSEWAGRYPSSGIIWITDDKEFAGVAMQKHINDLIVRPYDDERIRESISFFLSKCRDCYTWHIPASR